MTGYGAEMLGLIADLFPICRSITGDGVRATLEKMKEVVPMETTEVPSGTQVFDWTVPPEWNIDEAYLTTPTGERIADFAEHNLHVVSYSSAVDSKISLRDLQDHLHSIPEHPDWIPYRTTYYERNWGFCLPHRVREQLSDGTYHARIASRLDPGHLTYGECLVPGQSSEEVLVFSHVCHPSIANDNLSGLAVTAWWAKHLQKNRPYFTYRFVWAPGTIGAIAWLALNRDRLSEIRCGLVAVLLGRPGKFHYKMSRRPTSRINKVVESVLEEAGIEHHLRNFEPYGYDERQFGSPGIDLPVGRLTRIPNGEYPEYHTSADNVGMIDAKSLEEALQICVSIGERLDENRTYLNLQPFCEPQLGKRGLYDGTGGETPKQFTHAMLWLLSQSDGETDILEISRSSGLRFSLLRSAADALADKNLLRTVA